MKQEISTIAGADKETFISQVNAAAGLSEYFGSHCLFSIGNDVISEETVKNCGIYQESPEFYAFHLKACINMARTSKFIIDRLQFGDINSETDFIRECNETLRSIKPDIWVHDRNISDMQDSLFAIKLVAACEKAGIKLDANSLEYDEKGCFRCANTLRDYLKAHKPIDIDSLLNNEEGFTLENILEKCPEFSALPTTYQIEVLEHWRERPFTEEEVIKWVFNNPEIFEIAAAFPKDQLDLHKHKRFLMLENVKLLRDRLKNNPNKEKFVLAYLRLMDERDIACDELEVAKGALPEISYFELLYELGILSNEAPNARSVHLKGLFVSDEALTVEQKIYRFYILGAPNCTSEEINAISSYIEGVFNSNPKARNKAARNGNPYAKRAVEYLIDNYDQLTLADRKKLVKITSNRSNVTDEQKRALDCLSLSYLGIIGEKDKKSLEDVVLGKVDNIAQGEGSQLHNLLELSAQLTENARQTFLSHPELGKVYFNQINKLSFEQRKIILSVFDSMDQLLCEKISGYLLEQRFDAGTLFKFLSKIADPQNAKIELYPGITYSKFFEIISSKTKATMKIYDPTHNSWKSYDLREPFIDFMSNLISKGVLYKDRNLICAQLRLEFQEFYRKQFNELVIRSVDSTLPIYGMFAMGNDIISSDSFAIGIYQMSPQFYKFYFKACQNMTRYSRFIVNSLKFEALSSNGDFVVRCADKITEINPEIGMGTDREISDMQDGWFAIKLVAACKGKEAILLDENSLKYDDVGNFPCNESLRKYLIANKPKGIDEIIDNINELTLEKILEKCPELSALPVTYQIEVLESWRGIQFTKEEVIKWVFNNPEVFEIAACFKADQPCKYKGFLINETVKLLRERLKDDPNKEKYVFAYLRLIDKNECGFIGLNLQKGVLGNITYFELLHELGILPKDASSPDLSDINGIFPSEQELTTEQKIYKYCLLAAANSNEYETQAAQFYLDGYLTGKNKIAFEYLAINHDKMTLEQRKGFAYFAIDRVSALRSDIRKEDGQIKSYEAQKAELEKGVKVKAQKIEVHLAKSPDGTYYYVDEFTNNYVKYKGKVVEIDGDYYEISGCDDVQDLKVRIVDGKFYRDRTPDELAKYNAEIAKIDRDISLEKSKKSSYEAQIPIAQRLQEDIALLLTDQTPQEREALKLLQNPSALSDKDKKNLEHFAYRRTAVLQSQLKTKKEEYAILLQDRSEGSNSKKRDNISERLSLEEQIANSIEMDQEAIAILPSTVKEKEAARDKKLLIAGGVIGGVLGLGTVATVVLYCLGVFGGSGLPFVSVPIGGSSNDDSKDKPTA